MAKVDLTSELAYLTERLEELENAANKLMLIINNLESTFYNDEFLKQNLMYALKERAAVAARIQHLKGL